MQPSREDSLVRSSRREAIIALCIAGIALVYTLVYCGLHAYGPAEREIRLVWGFPHWVFWGILVPWGCCSLASIVFAFACMTDEPLGDAVDADALAPAPPSASSPGEPHA